MQIIVVQPGLCINTRNRYMHYQLCICTCAKATLGLWLLLCMCTVHQWLRSISDPSPHLTALEEAEIIPGEDSDTRIKPLALTNGYGRYITVTPERTLASVGECPLDIQPLKFCPFYFRNGRVTAVLLLKPPNGGFRIETAVTVHGRFGSETDKILTAIYVTDIPQRTQVSVRV